MLVKAIFKVNLQFGNPRSFEQAVKIFNHKLENLYKGEICVKQETLFDEETFSLSIPNLVVTTLEKTIKNTAYLLDDMSQFAMSGKGHCWILDSGRATFTCVIEPNESKTIVQAFIKGRQLAKEAGHEMEAIEALTSAITKFDCHWTALERRGYVYGLMGDFEQALVDFNRSLSINPHQADAYFSRGRVLMMQNKHKEAIPDFDMAWKNANPQLPLYWSARRVKAECCMKLGQFVEAAQELKFFTKQNFNEDNPNFPWRKSAWLNYSRALSETKAEQDARAAFITAHSIKDNLEPVIEGAMLDFCNKMSLRCGVKIPAEITDPSLELV